MTTKSQDLIRFVATAARRPATVGAIAPSSQRLCERLAAVVRTDIFPNVVELGPGTGSVSAAIEQRIRPPARHLGIECDPRMVDYLRRTRPNIEVVHGDAANLHDLLAEHRMPSVDAVVSGLPWALIDTEVQDHILDEVTAALAPDGVFTTFAYLHALRTSRARQFRESLHARFDEVLVTAPVWRNAPPAITYVCRRAVGRADAA